MSQSVVKCRGMVWGSPFSSKLGFIALGGYVGPSREVKLVCLFLASGDVLVDILCTSWGVTVNSKGFY